MNNKRLQGCTLISAMLLSVSAMAGETYDWRVSAALGYGSSGDFSAKAIEKALASNDNVAQMSNLENGDLAYALWFGYQVSPYWELEVGYLNFGEREADFSTDGSASEQDVALQMPISGDGLAWAVRPAISFSERWSAYGRVGVLFWQGEQTSGDYSHESKGADLLLGAGVEFAISSQWLLGLGWDRAEFDGDANNMMTLAVSYRL
ncbi:MAG: porin family protein [Shewanella sp.]|nr:porin family protein [Shewanella sp.]